MDKSHDISVRVLDDGRRAEVHVPAGIDAAYLTPALLRTIASEAKIQITASVNSCLEAVVADYQAAPRDLVSEIARAVEPVNGADSVWVWEAGFDPAAVAPVNVTGEQTTDHYASHIVSVASGTPVARVIPPTGGVDGRSVTGAVLAARAGGPSRFVIGEGLQVRPDGVVVATCDGVLRIAKNVVSISVALEIKGSVDFSTGHIDFKGDVVIADAIRDGFQVRATGSISVKGSVEGATIVCGGDLSCPRGIASARRPLLTVSGATNVGFLRNVSATLSGDVECRGEIEHCDIIVGGKCCCDRGRLIGGTLALTGTAHIGTVGSPEWTPTTVCVGDLPMAAIELRRVCAEAARIHRIVAVKSEQLRGIESCGGTRSAGMREQLTELQFELSELQREEAEVEALRVKLQESMQQHRSAELHILRMIYPRVRIQHGNMAFEFDKELKGPLQLQVDSSGSLWVRISTQEPRPITDFARAVPAIPLAAQGVDSVRPSAKAA